MPSLVAVACFLPGRPKDLSVSPPTVESGDRLTLTVVSQQEVTPLNGQGPSHSSYNKHWTDVQLCLAREVLIYLVLYVVVVVHKCHSTLPVN